MKKRKIQIPNAYELKVTQGETCKIFNKKAGKKGTRMDTKKSMIFK